MLRSTPIQLTADVYTDSSLGLWLFLTNLKRKKHVHRNRSLVKSTLLRYLSYTFGTHPPCTYYSSLIPQDADLLYPLALHHMTPEDAEKQARLSRADIGSTKATGTYADTLTSSISCL